MKKILLFAACMHAYALFAQNEYKTWFLPVSKQDLSLKSYDKDSSANAVVLAEYGSSTFTNVNVPELEFQYHVRIKIFKKEGFDQAGTVLIPLRMATGSHESVSAIKATTFNMEADSSIVQTKLDSKNIYTEQTSKNFQRVKFTLPNLREGSVIEYSYRILSPYLYYLRQWDFQSFIPKEKTEYETFIPEVLDYQSHLQGYLTNIKVKKDVTPLYFDLGDISKTDRIDMTYAMLDVPAFKEEPYMASSQNFLSVLSFEIRAVKFQAIMTKQYNVTWEKVVTDLLNDGDFGGQIRRAKEVFKKSIDSIHGLGLSKLDQAKAIFKVVRAGAISTNHNYLYADKGIKTAFLKKSATPTEINLALIGALRGLGLDIDPLILSTRDNGYPTSYYPEIEDFNYVIGRLKIDSISYFLDATSKEMSFGLVPSDCINYQGRLLHNDFTSEWVSLNAPMSDKSLRVVDLALGGDGKITGKIISYLYGYRALEQRKKIHSFANQEDYLEDLAAKMTNLKISDIDIKNLNDPELPLEQTITVRLNNTLKGKSYLNPFIIDHYKENPFKSNERIYPIDMVTPTDETVRIILRYPAGYKVTGLPAKTGLLLPDKAGRYILEADDTDNVINIATQLKLDQAVYAAEQYDVLKELYRRVVLSQTADLLIEKN